MVLTCMFTRNNNFYLSTSYFCQTSMDQRTFALQDGHTGRPQYFEIEEYFEAVEYFDVEYFEDTADPVEYRDEILKWG